MAKPSNINIKLLFLFKRLLLAVFFQNLLHLSVHPREEAFAVADVCKGGLSGLLLLLLVSVGGLLQPVQNRSPIVVGRSGLLGLGLAEPRRLEDVGDDGVADFLDRVRPDSTAAADDVGTEAHPLLGGE